MPGLAAPISELVWIIGQFIALRIKANELSPFECPFLNLGLADVVYWGRRGKD
jgi:hypothetical protein